MKLPLSLPGAPFSLSAAILVSSRSGQQGRGGNLQAPVLGTGERAGVTASPGVSSASVTSLLPVSWAPWVFTPQREGEDPMAGGTVKGVSAQDSEPASARPLHQLGDLGQATQQPLVVR